MSKIKKYSNFLNENIQMLSDPNYKYLVTVIKKCTYEQTSHFYMKEPLEIGTCKSGKFYLNYLDVNEYDNHMAFWIVYNERPDNLNGTRWDSSVIWEERGELQYIEDEHKKQNFQLYPNYLEIIADKIRSYPDLNDWIKYVVDTCTLHRKYHRWAIASADKRTDKKLTWEEHLDWTRNNIEIDKMLNRHTHPYDEKRLKEMEDLGEVEYKKKTDKMNQEMKKIFKELEDEGAFKK
jgi:hypothetical protein